MHERKTYDSEPHHRFWIGYGNMAQAIAQGFVDAGVVTGGQMVALCCPLRQA